MNIPDIPPPSEPVCSVTTDPTDGLTTVMWRDPATNLLHRTGGLPARMDWAPGDRMPHWKCWTENRKVPSGFPHGVERNPDGTINTIYYEAHVKNSRRFDGATTIEGTGHIEWREPDIALNGPTTGDI